MAATYLAALKAMVQIHQHNHWTTNGDSFYGDHLLFSKIYETALEDLDLAAEKFMGIFGDECLNYDIQIDYLSKILKKYSKLQGSPAEMSLAIERDFIKLSSKAYDCFQDHDKLTLGLDDMIMSVSSNREEAVYLIQQKLK